MFPLSKIPVRVPNKYCVPCLSPLQYSGGKVWLMPHVRKWLSETHPKILIEPFAGGAIVSLSAVIERLVQHAIMIELDADVAAFWHAILKDPEWMAERIVKFKPSRKRVKALIDSNPSCLMEHGFRTLIHNRVSFGGIIHRAGIKNKSLNEKWYPVSVVETNN